MNDPVLTTSAAAHLLGVSIRTVQTWIEQGVIESWKTPGGHRRVRQFDVLALRERQTLRQSHAPVPVLLIGSEALARQCKDRLGSIAGIRITVAGDAMSGLIEAGYQVPAAIVVELGSSDWERLALLRRLLASSALVHTRIVIVSETNQEQIRVDVGDERRIQVLAADSSPEALRAAILPVAAVDSIVVEPSYPVPADEVARLHAVARTLMVDSAEQPDFDAVVAMAARLFDTPICLITFLTPDRQWFKARHGLSARETPRSWAFCNYTIMQKEIFVVEDATADERFSANPLVTADPVIRFYAGAALRDYDGYPLGALCVIDRKPRQPERSKLETLQTLAALTSDKINLQIRNRQIRWAGRE